MITLVSRHTHVLDAHIIKGRLEAEGIPTYIIDNHFVWMYSIGSQAIGEVKIFVPSAFKDQATTIVENINSGHFILNDPEEEIDVCPYCQSTQLTPIEWPRKVSLAMLILSNFIILALPIPFSTRYFKCTECNNKSITKLPPHIPLFIRFFAFWFSFLVILILVLAIKPPSDEFSHEGDQYWLPQLYNGIIKPCDAPLNLDCSEDRIEESTVIELLN